VLHSTLYNHRNLRQDVGDSTDSQVQQQVSDFAIAIAISIKFVKISRTNSVSVRHCSCDQYV